MSKSKALSKQSELQQLANQWDKLTVKVIKKERDLAEALEIIKTLQQEQNELRVQLGVVQANMTARMFSTDEPEGRIKAIPLAGDTAILAMKGHHCQRLELLA